MALYNLACAAGPEGMASPAALRSVFHYKPKIRNIAAGCKFDSSCFHKKSSSAAEKLAESIYRFENFVYQLCNL